MTTEDASVREASQQPVEGRSLKKPVVVRHLLTNQNVSSIDAVFYLKEADFMRLTGPSSKSKLSSFAALLLSALFGFLLGLFPKLIPLFKGEESTVVQNDWIAVGVWTVITVIVFLISLCVSSERKQVFDKINSHFKNADSSYAVTRGAQNE